jgi:hypothetical protein
LVGKVNNIAEGGVMDVGDAFNNLPDDTRKIYVAMEIKLRMQHLTFEKRRLKSAYNKSVREIDAHMRNLQSSLGKLERELSATQPNADGIE